MHLTRNSKSIIKNLARDMSVEEAALLAVLEVESSGETHINHLVPIRWEGHYFWRLLPAHLRDKARLQGLAHPRSQAIKNPGSMAARYRLLDRARAIDEEAALKSISMGVGQVMGAHAEKLGFTNVFEMWDINQSAEGQYETVARYIKHFGLVDELQEHNWAGFARAYNGPAYAKHGYDRKIAAAYERNVGGVVPGAVQTVALRIGDRRRSRVTYLQERLNEIGYNVTVDGDFGPETKRQIQNFQIDNGLTADGVVGEETQLALDHTEARPIIPERENTTVKELRKRSRIARNGSLVQKTGATVTVAAAGSKAADEMGLIERVSFIGDKVSSAVEAFRPLQLVWEFAADNTWAFAAIGGAAIAILGSRIVSARLEDHRTGKTS